VDPIDRTLRVCSITGEWVPLRRIRIALLDSSGSMRSSWRGELDLKGMRTDEFARGTTVHRAFIVSREAMQTQAVTDPSRSGRVANQMSMGQSGRGTGKVRCSLVQEYAEEDSSRPTLRVVPMLGSSVCTSDASSSVRSQLVVNEARATQLQMQDASEPAARGSNGGIMASAGWGAVALVLLGGLLVGSGELARYIDDCVDTGSNEAGCSDPNYAEPDYVQWTRMVGGAVSGLGVLVLLVLAIVFALGGDTNAVEANESEARRPPNTSSSETPQPVHGAGVVVLQDWIPGTSDAV